MGFSIILASSIMIITLLILALSIISMLYEPLKLNKDMLDLSYITYIRDTTVKINNINIDNSTKTVTIYLLNQGNTKLWDYEHFDLIITYENVYNNRITEHLTYARDWDLTIDNDTMDPKILNPNEQAIIKANLAYYLGHGIVIVTLVTDNGVTSSYAMVI